LRHLDNDLLRSIVLKAIFEHATIQNIFDRVFAQFQLPLNYFDTSFTLVANALPCRPFYFAAWESFASNGRASQEEIDDGNYLSYQEKMNSLGCSAIFDSGNCAVYHQACGPVKLNGSLIGYMGTMILDAVPEDAIKFNDIMISAIETLARNEQKSRLADTTSMVLDIRPFLRPDAASKLENEAFSAQYKPPYVFAVLTAYNASLATLKYVQDLVCRNNSSVFGACFQESYLYLIKSESSSSELCNFEDMLNDLAERYNLYGAISDNFFASNQIYLHCAQAMEALAVGAARNRITKFTDIYQDIISIRMLEHFDIDECIQLETRKLLSLEPAYYETAKIYAISSGRLSATAAKLNIHKNTVLNRIEKIKELCGLDLSDKTVALSFLQQLALLNAYKLVKQGEQS
jgi:hypothetical protein